MRKIMVLVSLMVFFSTATVICETENFFFDLVDPYIHQVIDCSEKKSIVLKSTYDREDVYQVNFDFTSGNQSLMLQEKGRCKVYYFVYDSELMSALMQMVTLFNEIENQLPKGKALEYQLRFSGDEIQYITVETISRYYPWLDSILEKQENEKRKGDENETHNSDMDKKSAQIETIDNFTENNKLPDLVGMTREEAFTLINHLHINLIEVREIPVDDALFLNA